MAEKNDASTSLYCANAMLPHIETLQNTAKKITKRKNIEDIHDLRVASRRIRTCLNIFSDYFPEKKSKTWTRDLKTITKAYGAVRDLDVQIDLVNKIYSQIKDPKKKSGLRRIRLRLRQQREKKQAKTTKVTNEIIKSPILAEMKGWCEQYNNPTLENNQEIGTLFQLGYMNIQNHLDELLFYEVFIFDPLRVKELHQMRIAAKKLRYSLEIFSRLYQQKTDFALNIARQAQEYLGQIHDADVWISYLPEFMESEKNRIKQFYGYTSPFSRLKPGIEYLLENRQKERRKLHQKFLENWREWKMNETWLNLRKVIFLTSAEDFRAENEKLDGESSANPNTGEENQQNKASQ